MLPVTPAGHVTAALAHLLLSVDYVFTALSSHSLLPACAVPTEGALVTPTPTPPASTLQVHDPFLHTHFPDHSQLLLLSYCTLMTG